MDTTSGRFGSVLTAMVTPFDDSCGLDLDEAQRLARWLVEQGNDGLVVAGSTGEGSTLSDDEKVDLWRAVSEAVTVPVLAAAGSNDTRHSIELVKRATDAGAAGILAVTPYYNRPSQLGIEEHFRALAAATQLPMLLYDIPSRCGRKIENDTMLRLTRLAPNIVGVKDAAGDIASAARLLAAAPSGFDIYSGDDALTLALLSIGASGLIGVATHWSTPQHQEMVCTYAKGDVERARQCNVELLDSFGFETSIETPNPLPAKAMMRVLGFAVGQCRLPMGAAPDGLEQQARSVLDRLQTTLAS